MPEAIRARALERPREVLADGVALTRLPLLALVDVATDATVLVLFDYEPEAAVAGAREGSEGVGAVAVIAAGVTEAFINVEAGPLSVLVSLAALAHVPAPVVAADSLETARVARRVRALVDVDAEQGASVAEALALVQ